MPFLLFQTYFLSISRSAETESLAIALINFGYYFLTKKKWFWFAIIALEGFNLQWDALLSFINTSSEKRVSLSIAGK